MFDRAKLAHFAPGDGLDATVQTTAFDDRDWLDIDVPGDVHRTLIAAGKIPDPFFADNETECAWMEEREWWYRLRFTAPDQPLAVGERLRLVFHGLDTFVTIWLDGVEVGKHQNMFRPAELEFSEHLNPGQEHVLALCFDRPLAHVDGKTLSTWGRNPERTGMRKAQFGYGWDWGPRLPTIGVWRPIELRRERQAILTGVHLSTIDLAPDHSRAAVAIRIESERFSGTAHLTARVQLTNPSDGVTIDHEIPLTHSEQLGDTTCYLTIDSPSLWWTHDLGVPAQYDLNVTLLADGHEVDRWLDKAGIRTIELDQSPDHEERGTTFFRFVLNGVPVFSRGADWIPCDSFVGVIPPERYTRLIETVHDGNMTMLRVWGGGLYEHDIFYEECDRLGILVWQDFMFACAMYPEDDPAFVAEVAAEARYQVRRLRNHPSLALWCGNNENQWLHDKRYWNDPTPPAYGELYYNDILPHAVKEGDGRTPYWPGSPFGGDDHNSMNHGNRHNWDVWHGQFPRRFGERSRQEFTAETVSFLRYGEDMGRFVSEFGMHAAPALSTLQAVIPADQLSHHSPLLDWHNKDNPKNKGDLLLETVTGLPRDLTDYLDFSQIAQAEGLKFANEHYRRRKPHCSGALVWQLNDCWPGLSWSVLDYYGIGKAGYWYLRRAFAPILASFQPLPDGGVALWLTNDTLTPVSDTAVATLATFAGEAVSTEEFPLDVPANTSTLVKSWTPDVLPGGPDRYLRVDSERHCFTSNRHFFAAIKDLVRTPQSPRISVSQESPTRLQVALTADPTSYTILTRLTVPSPAAKYSDNAFDLAPSEHRTISIDSPDTPITPEMITMTWR